MVSRPLRQLTGRPFDVLVIGGGINGAATFHALATAGFRVVVVDQGDFASGTSQGSTMLVWGGLLYLRQLELPTVWRLSAARDHLIADYPDEVRPATLRWIPVPGGRGRALVQPALVAYWLMGLGRRARPRFVRDFPESALLLRGGAGGALAYEEGVLTRSDARFVLSWILRAESPTAVALNHTTVHGLAYDAGLGCWRADIADGQTGDTGTLAASVVVNAAGGWTDDVNAQAGIITPYRHVLARGVSLTIARAPCHQAHVILDLPGGGALNIAPWGPVSLIGATETVHASIGEARMAQPADVAALLATANAHLKHSVQTDDVISVRCGVRPLAVRRDRPVAPNASSLTRRHRIHVDRARAWISVYGGKLSGCAALASAVTSAVQSRLGHRRVPGITGPPASPDMTHVTGLDAPVVAPAWAAAQERCRTLDDYLRRRTNIAQWLPRSGFGRRHEHEPALRALALDLHGDAATAEADLLRTRARADDEWRRLFPDGPH